MVLADFSEALPLIAVIVGIAVGISLVLAVFQIAEATRQTSRRLGWIIENGLPVRPPAQPGPPPSDSTPR